MELIRPSYFQTNIFSKFSFTNCQVYDFIVIFSYTWDAITLLYNRASLLGSRRTGALFEKSKGVTSLHPGGFFLETDLR